VGRFGTMGYTKIFTYGLCKLHFIMDEYGWKSKNTRQFLVKVFYVEYQQNLRNSSWDTWKIHLCNYVNRGLLWINKAENRNCWITFGSLHIRHSFFTLRTPKKDFKSLCAYHSMNVHGRLKLKLHAFLTWIPKRGAE
jgi:hypothetical protein